MRSKKAKAKRTFVYQGNAEARAVHKALLILDMIIELGWQPAPSDLADVLDKHMASQPGRIPHDVRLAIVKKLRKAPHGLRSVTIKQFLEKYRAAVLESESLQRTLKNRGEKSPYNTANRETARQYGMSTKKLERLRTLYRERFSLEPENKMPSRRRPNS